jgi:hypothetical protein
MAIRNVALAAVLFGGTAVAALAASSADRSFPVGGFERVQATGSEDVTITTGKAPSVVATGPSDRLDRLDIRVEGDTLKIGHKPGNWMSWGNDNVRIRVTVPAVKGVKLAGSGKVALDHGSGPDFAADLSGSGDLTIAHLETQSALFSTAGSGNITAAGQCASAKVSIAGSGDMSLGTLRCTDIDVRIAGSGDVTAMATRTATIKVAGSGDVKVTGGARCQSRVSGSGTVVCG